MTPWTSGVGESDGFDTVADSYDQVGVDFLRRSPKRPVSLSFTQDVRRTLASRPGWSSMTVCTKA